MNLIEYVCNTYGYSEFVANGLIMSGQVLINDEVCMWSKYKIKKDDFVRIRNKKKKYVTRSGYKLEKAIQSFNLNMNNSVVIDLGASEGGFTDCILKQGAKKVYAVDVAYGILDYSLRMNSKVVVLERMNARFLTEEQVLEKVDFLTADVSFISLNKVIPSNLKFLREDGKVVLLFKPQFELKKELLGKNGIPKSEEDIVNTINNFVLQMKKCGLSICDIIKSPIKGNSGNTEYLLLGKIKECDTITNTQIKACVKKQ